MTIGEVTTKEQLDRLYAGSAFTIEGLEVSESSLKKLFDWIRKYTDVKQERVFVVKGKTMNDVYGLTLENAYPDDVNIVCIELSDLVYAVKIAFPRFAIGGRWFDDVVDNNAIRQNEINGSADE